jgi:methionine synthase II (cobalamin-independent)
MAVRTTVAGSWWPQPTYQEQLARYHRDELSEEEGEQVLRDAASTAIKEQMDLGLDEWTGGEYFAFNFIVHVYKHLTGVEIDRPERDPVVDYGDIAHGVITGEVDAPNGLGYAKAFVRENALPGGVNKATAVGPLELMPFFQDGTDSIMTQMPNLVRIVNRELRALDRAGCPNIQLDVPFIGLLVNTDQMPAKQAAEVIASCFEGVAATKSLHICCGTAGGRPACPNLHNAPWVGILKHLDGVVDIATLECSYFAQYMDRDAFKELPQSIELAAGIVSESSYFIEPVWKIRELAEAWARVVGEDRLWISASCGFSGHPERNIPVLRAKMENMVEAASYV